MTTTGRTAPARRRAARRPSDTYGQLRDAGGNVLRSGFLGPVETPRRARSCPRACRTGPRRSTIGDLPRAEHRPRRRDLRGRRRAAGRHEPDPAPAAARRGHRDRRRAARCSASSPGSWCASACGRWTGWATPRRRSPAATSRTASSTTDPRTEVGRLGLALNRMLDRLEQAFAEREASRSGCGDSSPTPRTSCARRWPRSAATRSCSAWARPASRRTSRRRCGGSRRRRRAWACWSRTC